MDSYVKSIQSHLDEIAQAAANLRIAANGYEQRIKELKPVAEGLEKLADEVRVKQAELADAEMKLADARKRLKDIRDSIK